MDILMNFRAFYNKPLLLPSLFTIYNFVCFSFGIKKHIVQKLNFRFEKMSKIKLLNTFYINFHF